MKTKRKYKETVLSARKLLQYFQLPDKNYILISKETVVSTLQYIQLPDINSIDISRSIRNSLRYFKIAVYLFYCFSRNP
jgi:hypothetical protein